MKDTLTLIVNNKAKKNNLKVKPLLVGEKRDSNLISVSFSSNKAIRGYYSYEVNLSPKSIALLYVVWYTRRYKSNSVSAIKRRKFRDFLNEFSRKRITYEQC